METATPRAFDSRLNSNSRFCSGTMTITKTPRVSSVTIHPSKVMRRVMPVGKFIGSVPLLAAVPRAALRRHCGTRQTIRGRSRQPVVIPPKFARRVDIARLETHDALSLEDHEQLTAARVLVQRQGRVDQILPEGTLVRGRSDHAFDHGAGAGEGPFRKDLID